LKHRLAEIPESEASTGRHSAFTDRSNHARTARERRAT